MYGHFRWLLGSAQGRAGFTAGVQCTFMKSQCQLAHSFWALDASLEPFQASGRVSWIFAIAAINAAVKGQTTAYCLTDRFAHGVPVGAELDYLDEGTVSAAMKARTEVLTIWINLQVLVQRLLAILPLWARFH